MHIQASEGKTSEKTLKIPGNKHNIQGNPGEPGKFIEFSVKILNNPKNSRRQAYWQADN